MKVWAPGRINLIGEHTDYSGGLVLPAAIELGLAATVERRSSAVRLSSASFGESAPFAADGSGPTAEGWARFGQAVAAELNELGRPPVGMTATIASTLPAGAGLSSSAALEVAIALALCAVAEFHVEPLELASLCQRAERRAVGVPCGILDQAACVLGQPDAAILLDCTSLERKVIPVPTEAAFLVIDSGIPRRLEHTAYADRQRELEQALTLAGRTSPRETTLEDLTPLDPLLGRRLRHVMTENERVRELADALEANDLERAGGIVSAGHASLRDDFEVSLPEIDRIVAAAEDRGALGARLLGGGFGGMILALAEASRADELAEEIGRPRHGARPPIVVHPSRGAYVDASTGSVVARHGGDALAPS